MRQKVRRKRHLITMWSNLFLSQCWAWRLRYFYSWNSYYQSRKNKKKKIDGRRSYSLVVEQRRCLKCRKETFQFPWFATIRNSNICSLKRCTEISRRTGWQFPPITLHCKLCEKWTAELKFLSSFYCTVDANVKAKYIIELPEDFKTCFSAPNQKPLINSSPFGYKSPMK